MNQEIDDSNERLIHAGIAATKTAHDPKPTMTQVTQFPDLTLPPTLTHFGPLTDSTDQGSSTDDRTTCYNQSADGNIV